MKTLDQWCLSCRALCPHERADSAVVCGGCGQVTPVPEALLDLAFTDAPPVVEMADCRWCNEKKPVGHDCPAGAVGCTNRQPDETPCGICARCIEVMQSDPRYGSPSDLYTPEETPMPDTPLSEIKHPVIDVWAVLLDRDIPGDVGQRLLSRQRARSLGLAPEPVPEEDKPFLARHIVDLP